MENIWSRVVEKNAYEVIHYGMEKLMYENLLAVGGVKYDKKEMKFAQDIYKTLNNPSLPIKSSGIFNHMNLSKGRVQPIWGCELQD